MLVCVLVHVCTGVQSPNNDQQRLVFSIVSARLRV
jgi:hypothetical protein